MKHLLKRWSWENKHILISNHEIWIQDILKHGAPVTCEETTYPKAQADKMWANYVYQANLHLILCKLSYKEPKLAASWEKYSKLECKSRSLNNIISETIQVQAYVARTRTYQNRYNTTRHICAQNILKKYIENRSIVSNMCVRYDTTQLHIWSVCAA